MNLIWENPSPKADFEQQYIQLSLKSNLYLIVFKLREGAGVNSTYIFTPNNTLSLTMAGDDSKIYYRPVNVEESSNRLFIGSCQNINDWTISNAKMIPLRIYGIN